jgi:DNA-binding protein HU-beta
MAAKTAVKRKPAAKAKPKTRSATTRRAPAKKTTAKKTTARKAPARKPAAKKTVAKKAPAKKTAADWPPFFVWATRLGRRIVKPVIL